MNFNTDWVYSTQEEDFDAVSFAEHLKEKGWNNMSIAAEMANRFIYRCLLNNGDGNYIPPIGKYDLEDTSITWDEEIINRIIESFEFFIWQYFVDDEDDYDPKELDYSEEINGVIVHININDSYDHSITFSIETK